MNINIDRTKPVSPCISVAEEKYFKTSFISILEYFVTTQK